MLHASSPKLVQSKKGMVVAAEPIAAKVGAKILAQGGNAVDAAVAVGFALAVTYPTAGNIGGGGFMNIRFADGKTITIDYREKAPLAATKNMYLDEKENFLSEKNLYGHLASGVPGSVAGMLLALEKFGTLQRNDVIQPAVELAEKGFPIHPRLATSLKENNQKFSKFSGSIKSFTNNGKIYEAEEILRQPDLARTLQRIIIDGKDGFYKSKTADLIVEEMKRGNGLITHEDLEKYQAVIREPVKGTYRGYEIISMAPPSSGGIALLQLLKILENYDLKSYGWNSAKSVHILTEAMRRVYADRAEYLGDPDFVKVPVNGLLSEKYLSERMQTIDTVKATPSSKISHGNPVPYESEQTTHYSIVDQYGNCVSVTTTLNGGYGSHVVVNGAGFLLNNEMDDFSAKPGSPNMYGLIGSEANSITPEKRMLSSMTPTIILKNGKPFMVIGTPGGSTIITTVLQVIINVIDFGMNIQEAINAPRIHHQWLPDKLMYEKNALSTETIEKLQSMGHTLEMRTGPSGLAEGIMFDGETGEMFGASDIRGYGAAVGN